MPMNISQMQLELTDVGDVIVTDIVVDEATGEYVRDLRVYGTPAVADGTAPLLVQLRVRASTHTAIEVTAPPVQF